jgi:DNA-binding transcriptional MerR regulator
MRDYRVDELAAESGVSVDTIRFYQARGLLDPPERQGRVAVYSDRHADRLRRIRDLKDKGLSLATIKLVLAGDLDPPDQALVAAVSAPGRRRGPRAGTGADPDEDAGAAAGPEAPGRRTWTLEEFAEQVGIAPAIVLAVEREGLFAPTNAGDGAPYTDADVAAARAGMKVLETGMPLADLLALAREYDEAARRTAERAVDLFDRYVREPIRSSAAGDAEAAERLVGAFESVLPATTALVAHHFERVLLGAARRRIAQLGTPGHRDTVVGVMTGDGDDS